MAGVAVCGAMGRMGRMILLILAEDASILAKRLGDKAHAVGRSPWAMLRSARSNSSTERAPWIRYWPSMTTAGTE